MPRQLVDELLRDLEPSAAVGHYARGEVLASRGVGLAAGVLIGVGQEVPVLEPDVAAEVGVAPDAQDLAVAVLQAAQPVLDEVLPDAPKVRALAIVPARRLDGAVRAEQDARDVLVFTCDALAENLPRLRWVCEVRDRRAVGDDSAAARPIEALDDLAELLPLGVGNRDTWR